ncbi:MAG: hypothetical protein KAG66_07795 [Methylococcales bacterium]|nr:hypothetical protein [Methylococcales bacterium]
MYPDDIYTDGVQYYGVGDGSAAATEMDAGAIETLKRLKGNPEGIVTIYRAVPDTINTINPGDWVTISENYAKDHAEDTGWHVISEEVRAKDIYTDGDSLHEWGYHPAIFTDTSPPTKATTSTQVETFLDRGSKRLNEVEKLEFLDDIEVEIPDIYQSAIGDFRKKKKKITTAALYSVVKAKLMGRKKYLTRQSIEKTLKWSPRAGVFHQELESLGFKWVGDNKISRSEGDFSPSFSEYYRHKDTGKTVRLSDHEPAQVRSTGRDVELHPGSFDSDKDALKALQDISTQETLESLMDSLSGDGIKLEAYESQRGGLEVIDLSLIEIPKPARKSGAGSKIMGELTDFADRHGKTIVLTPSTDFGATSVGRLVRFYKRFGFVENKGRNKNFKFRESMFREPNPAGRQ